MAAGAHCGWAARIAVQHSEAIAGIEIFTQRKRLLADAIGGYAY